MTGWCSHASRVGELNPGFLQFNLKYNILTNILYALFQGENDNKVGSFSYMIPDGLVSRTGYVADKLGYRVLFNGQPSYGQRDAVLPASTSMIYQPTVPDHYYQRSPYFPLSIHQTRVLPLVKRSSPPAMKQEHDRYPQLNSNPSMNLYNNTNPGQSYASQF